MTLLFRVIIVPLTTSNVVSIAYSQVDNPTPKFYLESLLFRANPEIHFHSLSSLKKTEPEVKLLC